MKKYLLLIFGLLLFVPLNSGFGQLPDESIQKQFEEVEFGDLILSIRTDAGRYISGHTPVILGSVQDIDGTPITTKVNLLIKDQNSNVVHQTSLSAENGKFRYTGFTTEHSGDFTIFAKAEHDKEVGYAKMLFEQRGFPTTKVGMGIFSTIFSIAGLLILIPFQIHKKWSVTKVEPLRFALLTLCSVIPLIILIAADVQLGQDTPVGMVLIQSSNVAMDDLLNSLNLSEILENNISSTGVDKFEWALHFGGSVHDNYQSGVIIPMYVLAFGLIGGYLRFLNKTQKGWFVTRAIYEIQRLKPNLTREEMLEKADEAFENANDTDKKNEHLTQRIIFNNSMEDLALIFLSPILAIASYLILVQGGVSPIENWPTIAVVSFATGLVTTEIIGRLEGFARSSIGNLENTDNKKEKIVPKENKSKTT